MTRFYTLLCIFITQITLASDLKNHLNIILAIESETVRLDSLKNFSNRMIKLRDDIVIDSEKALLKLAFKRKDFDVFGRYSASLGTYYLSTVRPQEAKNVFKKALKYQDKISDKWIGLIRSKRASVYINESKPDSVISDCKFAIDVLQKYKLDVYEGDAHLFMGIAYNSLDSLAMAISEYQKAQYIFEELEDVEYVNYCKENIADLFLMLKFYDEALSISRSMLSNSLSKYNIEAYLTLNEVYFETGDSLHYKNTLSVIDSVLENNIMGIEEQNLFTNRLYLFDHFIAINKLDDAFKVLNLMKGQKAILEIGANRIQYVKGRCLYAFYRKDVNAMKHYMDELKTYPLDDRDREGLIAIKKLEIKYNVLIGDYKTSYRLQEELMTLENAFKANMNANKMAYLRTQFETEKKEKELEIAHLEVENLSIKNEEKLYGLISVIFLSLLLIGIFALKSKNNKLLRNKTENDNLILQKEKEISLLKLQETERELELKEQELASHILSIVQKNELMDEMKKEIQLNLSDVNHSQKLLDIISHNNIQEQDWDDFNMRFSRVHEEFFTKLSNQFPQLSQSEKRLCALLKLNMNTKEIANVLHINSRSVDQKKYRLKKKMNIDGQEDIYSVINKI